MKIKLFGGAGEVTLTAHMIREMVDGGVTHRHSHTEIKRTGMGVQHTLHFRRIEDETDT